MNWWLLSWKVPTHEGPNPLGETPLQTIAGLTLAGFIVLFIGLLAFRFTCEYLEVDVVQHAASYIDPVTGRPVTNYKVSEDDPPNKFGYDDPLAPGAKSKSD